MERSVLGVKRRDTIENKEIKEKTGCICIGYTIRKLNVKYADHAVKTDKERWNYKAIMVWNPYECTSKSRTSYLGAR